MQAFVFQILKNAQIHPQRQVKRRRLMGLRGLAADKLRDGQSRPERAMRGVELLDRRLQVACIDAPALSAALTCHMQVTTLPCCPCLSFRVSVRHLRSCQNYFHPVDGQHQAEEITLADAEDILGHALQPYRMPWSH